ncbi:MAG: hypothetical protein ACI9V1_002740, partial [Spirosomataceae bacterium]
TILKMVNFGKKLIVLKLNLRRLGKSIAWIFYQNVASLRLLQFLIRST